MLLYCPNCQNLVLKQATPLMQGETLILTCPKCKKTITFFIKYKAVGKVQRFEKADLQKRE